MPAFSSPLPDTTLEDRVERLEQLPMRVSAGNAAVGQSILSFTSSGGISLTGGPSTDIYTVSAGKTFFITDIYITVNETTTPQLVQLKAAGVVILEAFTMSTLPFDVVGIESQASVAGGAHLSIQWPSDSGKLGAYFIAGFEQ